MGSCLKSSAVPKDNWPGHKAGQFLFANFGPRGEGAHPVHHRLGLEPRLDGTLTLAIKALGDFTARNSPRLIEAGQTDHPRRPLRRI